MPDRVHVNEELGIIEVESYGVVSKDDIAQSIAEARQILEERELRRILVDTTNQQAMLDTTSIFELFSTFPGDFKIAVLVQPSQITAEDVSFAETVAANRGIHIRIFSKRETSLQWLNG